MKSKRKRLILELIFHLSSREASFRNQGINYMITRNIGPFECLAGNWPPVSSKPIVLFIHGASLSKGLWKAQIEGLSDVSNPVSLDLPGHGRSADKGKDNIADYARAVLHFIREAGFLRENIVLCGMSMGGAIVQQLLIEHPDDFKAGILINTGARLKVLPAIFESIKKDFNQFIHSIPAISLSPQTDRAGFEKQIIEFSSQCDAETACQDFTACNRFDVMEKISSIACPVLVCSAEHDITTPPKYGAWLKEHLPHADYVQIANAAHLSMVEKSDDVNRAIREFLQKLA